MANPAHKLKGTCHTILHLNASLCTDNVVQAFGLLCLQRGPSYWLAALLLLERSVSIDPQLQPVLNWAKVRHRLTTDRAKSVNPSNLNIMNPETEVVDLP